MFLNYLFLLLFLFLPSITLSVIELNDDILGLIVFKSSLSDPHSKLSSWTDTDDNPCKWIGVTCDPNSHRVTNLILPNFSLSGSISSHAILRLQFLQHLSLSNNNLTGPITPDFSQLWGLQSLDLSGNSLSGPIPDELFHQCGNLKWISLARNKLSGHIPDSLPSCMTLQSLNLSSNQLSGRLPVMLWSLTGLQSLDLSHNKFTDEIPTGIGNMFGLQVVNLSKNSFTGGLPSEIGRCSAALKVIDFSGNRFSGEIPQSMTKLNACSSLILSGNLLTGELPNSVGLMKTLEVLDLSQNGLYGRLPPTIGNLQSLRRLDLSRNGFIGGVPDSVRNISGLVSIDVSHNLLTGELPNWVFGMGLRSVSLSGNRFSGRIRIQMEGEESSSLDGSGLYQNVEVLDLSCNVISGVIPYEIGRFRKLVLLNLSRNDLVGGIPNNIGEMKLIEVVDFSRNSLNGTIPYEIEGMGSLRVLRLEKNHLGGEIPNEIGNCSSLTSVDVSENNLSGKLPKELTNLSNLASFNVSHNQLEGELPSGSFFDNIPISSVSGNPSLCGSLLKKSCPATHPKPIVLNPNPSSEDEDSNNPPSSANLSHKKLVLSISALIAISAAAFILLGVVVVLILNARARNNNNTNNKTAAGSSSVLNDPAENLSKDGELNRHQSPMSDSDYGKLVMFSSNQGDFEISGSENTSLLRNDCEIGRGGFGVVYHHTTLGGAQVAIKKLNLSGLIKSQPDFEREVKTLANVNHPNLVSLKGYYFSNSLQLLINDYVSYGNLHTRLHKITNDDDYLTWSQRFNIITGIAKGLAYLHHEMNIIHYNLKSTNILLDESFSPKVSDYGLPNLLPVLDRYVLSSKIQSALGYMAPEFACKTVRITEKCDVYGFGVLVLEIVTGRKPVEYMEDDVIVLCDMVRESREEDCVDRRMEGKWPRDEVRDVIKVGLICASQVPSNRPDMAEVVNILELIGCSRQENDE